MSEYTLSAKPRLQTGKGPSRRLRLQEELPAVLSSKGKDALHLTVCPREATKTLRGPLKRNAIINLTVEGDSTSRTVMVKERQIHPTRRVLTHLDLVEIDVQKPVTVSVPVQLSGKSESVVLGGKLDQILQKMRVTCLPRMIPEFIDVDITHLPFGSTHTKEIPLPEALTLAEKPRVVVLTIKKPRGATKEEEASAQGGATPAKPAAAKPAAKPAGKK